MRYSGDYVLLKEVRDYYLIQLDKTNYKDIFDLVTTVDTVMDSFNIPELKDALDEIKGLKNFMKEYKKIKSF